MNQGFNSYRLYIGLTLHFTDDKYDFIKMRGGVPSATTQTFSKRKDRKYFENLGKRYKENSVKDFFISNFVNGDRYGGLYLEESESDLIYKKWKKRIQSITYNFKSDIELLLNSVDTFDELFRFDEQYPIILLGLYRGEVQIETFLILNQMLNFFPQFDKDLDEYQWPVTRRICDNYNSFLNVDLKKYREILKNKLDI